MGLIKFFRERRLKKEEERLKREQERERLAKEEFLKKQTEIREKGYSVFYKSIKCNDDCELFYNCISTDEVFWGGSLKNIFGGDDSNYIRKMVYRSKEYGAWESGYNVIVEVIRKFVKERQPDEVLRYINLEILIDVFKAFAGDNAWDVDRALYRYSKQILGMDYKVWALDYTNFAKEFIKNVPDIVCRQTEDEFKRCGLSPREFYGDKY